MSALNANPLPLLHLEHIRLYRLGKKVLKNFNLTIHKGENWIVLGPNGCGKSSLISLLQGHIWPQSGSVSVLGRYFGRDDITEIRRVIGWVGSELETLFGARDSAREILESGTVGTLGLKFDHPDSAQKKQVTTLIKDMALQSLVTKQFRNLSQGQRRLISIGRSVLTRPRLLLLDEASAGLDPVAREEFLQRLEGFGRYQQAPAILSATHHIEEIRPPFTHCLLLKAGGVFASGPIKKVVTSHNISNLFGRSIKMIKTKNRYQLQLK